MVPMTFTVKIFLAFHNLFMMLVHMEVHLKGYFLMSISLQKYTVWDFKWVVICSGFFLWKWLKQPKILTFTSNISCNFCKSGSDNLRRPFFLWISIYINDCKCTRHFFIDYWWCKHIDLLNTYKSIHQLSFINKLTQ